MIEKISNIALAVVMVCTSLLAILAVILVSLSVVEEIIHAI